MSHLIVLTGKGGAFNGNIKNVLFATDRTIMVDLFAANVARVRPLAHMDFVISNRAAPFKLTSYDGDVVRSLMIGNNAGRKTRSTYSVGK